MFTDPNATAAWSRGLSPELLLDVSLKTFASLCSGESPQLNFEDEGWVVLPHGDVPSQHRARGRGDGVLARRADAPSRPLRTVAMLALARSNDMKRAHVRAVRAAIDPRPQDVGRAFRNLALDYLRVRNDGDHGVSRSSLAIMITSWLSAHPRSM